MTEEDYTTILKQIYELNERKATLDELINEIGLDMVHRFRVLGFIRMNNCPCDKCKKNE